MGSSVAVPGDPPDSFEDLLATLDHRAGRSTPKLTAQSKLYLWTSGPTEPKKFTPMRVSPRMFVSRGARSACYVGLVVSRKTSDVNATLEPSAECLLNAALSVISPLDIHCPPLSVSEDLDHVPVNVSILFWSGRDSAAINTALGLARVIQFRSTFKSSLGLKSWTPSKKAALENLLITPGDVLLGALLGEPIPTEQNPPEPRLRISSENWMRHPLSRSILGTTIFTPVNRGRMAKLNLKRPPLLKPPSPSSVDHATSLRSGGTAPTEWRNVNITSRESSPPMSSNRSTPRDFGAKRFNDKLGLKLDLTKVAQSKTEMFTARKLERLNTPERELHFSELNEELRKTAKLKYFMKKCSKIADHIYVSGQHVATDLEILKANGIKHIVNCAGDIVPDAFKKEGLKYLTFCMKDSKQEDLTMYFPIAFTFIRNALRKMENVLVHCEKGVSRSSSIVIGYIMTQTRQDYETVFKQTKKLRSIISPNIGFMCQLFTWGNALSSNWNPAVYAKMVKTEGRVTYWLPKVETKNVSLDDPARGYVVRQGGTVWFFVGPKASPELRAATRDNAEHLAAIRHGTTREVTKVGGANWSLMCRALGIEQAQLHPAGSPSLQPLKGLVGTPRARGDKTHRAMEPKKNDAAARRPAKIGEGLFVLGTWTEVRDFDTDDLISDTCMILITKEKDRSGKRAVYAWIGQDAGLAADTVQRDVDAKMRETGLKLDRVQIEQEDNESDAFWEEFFGDEDSDNRA